MLASEIVARVGAVAPDARIEVEGADCNFTVVVVSEAFSGVPPLRRQQRVLAEFAGELQRGDLHALTVKAHTPEEWALKQVNGLTTLVV